MPWTDKSLLYEKINHLSLLLIAFTLPFEVLLCSYATTLFVLNKIILGNFFKEIKTALQKPWVLLFAGFYILHIIGLLYTTNMQAGLFDLEKKASLLVFPLLLTANSISIHKVVQILSAFVAACLLLSLILLATALYKYIHSSDPDYFILDNLSSSTGIHRVYASMYFLFCIFILYFLIQKERLSLNPAKILLLALILYFIIMILLLSSRIMVALAMISIVVLSIDYMIKTKRILSGSLLLGLLLAGSGAMLLSNEKIRLILAQTYTDLDKGNSPANYTGPNLRIQIWKAGLQIAESNIFGVGTGDVEDELYKQYVQNNFIWGIQSRFNAHNQYLQTYLGLGIIGLSVLLTSLLWPALASLRSKNFLYFSFLLLFFLPCFTESMLCTQKGIVFYAFFNSLLAFHYPGKNP